MKLFPGKKFLFKNLDILFNTINIQLIDCQTVLFIEILY